MCDSAERLTAEIDLSQSTSMCDSVHSLLREIYSRVHHQCTLTADTAEYMYRNSLRSVTEYINV